MAISSSLAHDLRLESADLGTYYPDLSYVRYKPSEQVVLTISHSLILNVGSELPALLCAPMPFLIQESEQFVFLRHHRQYLSCEAQMHCKCVRAYAKSGEYIDNAYVVRWHQSKAPKLICQPNPSRISTIFFMPASSRFLALFCTMSDLPLKTGCHR